MGIGSVTGIGELFIFGRAGNVLPETSRILARIEHTISTVIVISKGRLDPTEIWLGPRVREQLKSEIRCKDFADGKLLFASQFTENTLVVRFMECNGIRVGISFGERE